MDDLHRLYVKSKEVVQLWLAEKFGLAGGDPLNCFEYILQTLTAIGFHDHGLTTRRIYSTDPFAGALPSPVQVKTLYDHLKQMTQKFHVGRAVASARIPEGLHAMVVHVPETVQASSDSHVEMKMKNSWGKSSIKGWSEQNISFNDGCQVSPISFNYFLNLVSPFRFS